MALSQNVLTNIKNNYCCMYSCWEIENELGEIINKNNEEMFFIFKKLTEHFGRILVNEKDYFKSELGRETHWSLLKEIKKCALVKSISSKKYPGNSDVWLTFIIYR